MHCRLVITVPPRPDAFNMGLTQLYHSHSSFLKTKDILFIWVIGLSSFLMHKREQGRNSFQMGYLPQNWTSQLSSACCKEITIYSTVSPAYTWPMRMPESQAPLYHIRGWVELWKCSLFERLANRALPVLGVRKLPNLLNLCLKKVVVSLAIFAQCVASCL